MRPTPRHLLRPRKRRRVPGQAGKWAFSAGQQAAGGAHASSMLNLPQVHGRKDGQQPTARRLRQNRRSVRAAGGTGKNIGHWQGLHACPQLKCPCPYNPHDNRIPPAVLNAAARPARITLARPMACGAPAGSVVKRAPWARSKVTDRVEDEKGRCRRMKSRFERCGRLPESAARPRPARPLAGIAA